MYLCMNGNIAQFVYYLEKDIPNKIDLHVLYVLAYMIDRSMCAICFELCVALDYGIDPRVLFVSHTLVYHGL